MHGTETITLQGRDRALLRAVAAGRCQLAGGCRCEPVLLVDGLACTDSSAGRRLVDAGLLDPPHPTRPVGPVALTPAGRKALAVR